MSTLLYAPGDQVVIETINAGIIDVSDDVTQGSLTRRLNAVSDFSFSLRNARRKYDGIFTPNDRISVRLRRIRWVPVFTGYLNQVPMFTSYPRDVALTASCSLKRLKFFLIDPGTPAFTQLLEEGSFDAIRDVDGGLKRKVL